MGLRPGLAIFGNSLGRSGGKVRLPNIWVSNPQDRRFVRAHTNPRQIEEIILPKYDTEFYRSIDEVRRYIDSLKRALSRGEPLTLDSSELSSDGEKAQELGLRDSDLWGY